VAFVFRKVSKPVSSWNYGLITIITFLHDVILPIGVFAVLGHFAGVEVDTLFVVAILVVLGYSINDTIVVFDRIREKLGGIDEAQREAKFEEVVEKSLKDTWARSVNTSLTTFLALLAIYFVGGEVTKSFALAMIVGVVCGAYSSIFISAPLLVTIKKYQAKKSLKI
jgi:preprotein translocase subunit SecF